MKKFFASNSKKIVGFLVLFVVVFSLGAYARPGIDLTAELVSAVVFTKPVVYVAPLSEYEEKALAAFNDPKHQAVCLAQARATVSLELVQKYLTETKKQQALADYELPLSLIGE
jgi:hypothetical protein